MSLRNALRTGTSDCHDDVDRLFGRFDLSDRRQYGIFLTAHARVVTPVELALERGGIGRLLVDWPDRRRRGLLNADLDALGLTLPPLLEMPELSSDDALWGAAYVLEGSKLGGAMLAKQVPASLPASYLGHQGPKGAMKAFMERLDEAAVADEDGAVRASRSIFDHFRRAAELELELFAF